MFTTYQQKNTQHKNTLTLVNMVGCQPNVVNLYRGLHTRDKIEIFFEISSILLGQFGTVFPQLLTIEQLKQHKLTSASNEGGGNHLVGMSIDQCVGKNFGDGNYLTIDPALFRQYIIDVNETFGRHGLNLPGRIEREREYVAPAVLFCSIQYLFIDDKQMINPFYLPIAVENQQAIQQFQSIYEHYIGLLKNKYENVLDKDEEVSWSKFVQSYLDFYAVYAKPNPFAMTIDKLVQTYPDYMNKFLKINQSLIATCSSREDVFFKHQLTLGEIVVKMTQEILKSHPYLQEMHPRCEAMTVYDDPYACFYSD